MAGLHHNSWLLVLYLLILALLPFDLRVQVARWLHGNTENLSFKGTGIVISGNLGMLLLTKLAVSDSELMEPGYGLEGGRQYGVPDCLKYSDFYLKRGKKNYHILRGLNQEQKKVVSDAIIKGFPEVCAGAAGPASLLFGDETGVMSLGLSDSDQKSAKAQS